MKENAGSSALFFILIFAAGLKGGVVLAGSVFLHGIRRAGQDGRMKEMWDQ